MLQEDIEGLRAESHELSKRMRQTASLADKAWKESEGYAKIIGALEGKRIEARSLEVNIRKLSEHLVPVEESEEWLESTLAEFDSHQAEYHKEERALKDRYNHFKWEIQAKRGDQSAKQTEYGKHETAKAQYERQVQRRELLIQDIVRKNEIRGFDGELDEAEIADFLQTIKKLFRERNQALERERRAAQSELREAQSTLNQLGQRKSALQETKNSMRKQIVQNERQASTYQRLLDGISADEGIKAVLESRIDETEQAIARERERIRTASWDEAIESKTAEIRTQEERNSRLNAELINGTKRAGELARFEHLKKELADRQRSVETMSGAHGERIERYITQPWAPATLEHEFQTRLEAASADLAAAERERDAVSRDLERVDFQLRTTRKDLKQRQAQRDDCARRVNEATEEDDPADYPQVVVQLQNQLNLYKEDSDRYAGIKSYMESCLEIVRKKSACRTCNRAFRNDKESKAFENKIIDILNKPVDEEAVSQAEEDLEHVRVVGSYYDTWVRLSNTEIPELEKEAVELDGEREKVLSRVERHDQVRDERREAKQNVESLSKPVATISRCEHDIRTLRAQIDELAVNQQEPGATRTLEQIQEEISSVTEIVRALQKTIGKLSSEREESRSGLTRLELKLRDIRSELADTAHQLDKKAGLMARVDEYKELNAKQREGIAKADQDIEDIVPEVDKAQERYDDISSRAERRERELQQGVSQLTDHVHQLQMVGEEITTYIEHDGPRQLERCAAELAQIQEAIGELEGGQAMVTREANALAKRLQDSENTKRQYADNLHYRQEQRALDAVQGEIATLAAHNAEIDRGRFKQESERHTREHNALSAKQASKMGEMKSKDDQLMQLLADWNTDYKDAGPKYREAHIRVETTRAAADDLARYGGALDKAIMTYHGLKMEQINGIIAELWQKTYRGTDVDSICIRSDAEGARGNRSYNYRVCMRKLDVEMDMRGRCSAGQKVLASIIIRLALAECFGVACGLIALDEPTTNLDRDNIHSLALALHDIIRLRRQQANFQLIVITHDEDFLRAMRCGDFCDYYYRVGRNERQKSVVERQSIAEVCFSPPFLFFFLLFHAIIGRTC